MCVCVGMCVFVECVMEKLLLARDSNRVITEINHVEHAWELHSYSIFASAYAHTQRHTHTCAQCTHTRKGQNPHRFKKAFQGRAGATERLYHCKHSLSE